MKFGNISNPPIVPDAPILQFPSPRTNNTFQLVVSKKIIKEEKPKVDTAPYRADLIRLTKKLAEDAESGALKGLGGFADYENDYYMLGLEGSYLANPEAAVLPVKRLERRIMDQIIEHED